MRCRSRSTDASDGRSILRAPGSRSGSLRRAADSARRRSVGPLLYDELALHPRLPVAVDGAVVGVGPGLEGRAELRNAAVGDHRAVALAVDADVVRDRRCVLALD